MKKYLIKPILLLLLAAASLPAAAQDFGEDMKAMSKAYAALNDFSAGITVKVFGGDNETRPMTVKNATVKKKDLSYFYSIDDVTMLMNHDYIIMVNSSMKTISVNARTAGEKPQNIYQMAVPQLDSLLKKHDKVRYIGVEDNCRHYQVSSPKSIIEKTDLFIDMNTNLLTKLDYRYNASYRYQTRAIVEFQSLNTKAGLSDEEFSEKKFFTKDGKQLKASPSFARYKIVLASNRKF